jgi:hypothetical protein
MLKYKITSRQFLVLGTGELHRATTSKNSGSSNTAIGLLAKNYVTTSIMWEGELSLHRIDLPSQTLDIFEICTVINISIPRS